MIKDILFYFLSLIAIIASVYIIFQKDPIKSAIAMFTVFFATALIYMLLGLYFIGAIQLIIYSGSIIVIFVIAMNSMSISKKFDFNILNFKNIFIFITVAIFLTALSYFFIELYKWNAENIFDMKTFAGILFSNYLLHFELISLLLLVSVVIAYLFAKRGIDELR